jgi:hypothetical protein
MISSSKNNRYWTGVEDLKGLFPHGYYPVSAVNAIEIGKYQSNEPTGLLADPIKAEVLAERAEQSIVSLSDSVRQAAISNVRNLKL